MSELINARIGCKDYRRQLLTTASALALLASTYGTQVARAADNDADHPTVWIELGGQLERQTGQGGMFDPPFVVDNPASPAYKPVSPLQSERPPLFSNGVEGKLTFEPDGTDWVFSGSMRYGRANGGKLVNQRGQEERLKSVHPILSFVTTSGGFRSRISHCCTNYYRTPSKVNFAETQTEHRDAHIVADFQAGKDVGLGMFGLSGTSILSGGVRFAQFTSKMAVTEHAVPDLVFYKDLRGGPYYYWAYHLHTYAASARAARSFHGIGPSISWNGSTPFLGNPQAGELTFDWGANAAILFGRQRASGAHQTGGHYRCQKHCATANVNNGNNVSFYQQSASFNRARAVTAPNAGGFAGVSFNFTSAKVSLGYRGDFFFGAMDTGMDTRKTETVGFYGPFASISIGLGG